MSFNTQPPEGGWMINHTRAILVNIVSTHSRPKAAGNILKRRIIQPIVSTHSRPKAAGRYVNNEKDI